jgi:hypothetical protein
MIMKRLLLLLIFALCSSVAYADVKTHGMTIPTTGGQVGSGHPRLFWNSMRLNAAATWLTQNPFTPPPFTPGSNTVDVPFQHVVNPENSCSTAVTAAVNVVVPFGQWRTLGNGSDVARTAIEFVAAVYDWCHDQVNTSSPGSTTLRASSTPSPPDPPQRGIPPREGKDADC